MANDWTTVEVSLDPIMEPVSAVIASIDSVLAFLIALLNVVQFILNIVKAFLVGLLNPIRAIIEVIIAEIRQIISDLRQAGLYIADDADLITLQPVNISQRLLGGYSEYEKRMLHRLLDRSDPTRPDLSSASAVVALFFYISSGDLPALVELIRRIKAFFGQRERSKSAPFAAPTTPEAKLGTYGARPSSFVGASKVTSGPDAVTLSWTMPSTGTPFSKAPKGFLVHVSTVPDGYGIRAYMPDRENSQAVENLPIRALAGVDPIDGTELRLYGGMSDLSLKESFTEGGEDHAAQLYLSLDQNTPLISPDTLIQRYQDTGTPGGAATYFFKVSLSGLLPASSSYSCTLKKADLPDAFDRDGFSTADTFYARVRPVSKEFVNLYLLEGSSRAPTLIDPDLDFGNLYTITNDDVVGSTGTVLNPGGGSEATGTYGKASEPVKVSFPTASQLSYQEALKAALLVLVLVRPDLVEEPVNKTTGEKLPTDNTYAEGFATGLEGFAKDLLQKLTGGIDFSEAPDPTTFSDIIRANVEKVADEMLMTYNPSESMLEAVGDEVTAINDFTWDALDDDLPPLGILTTLTAGRTGSTTSFFGYAATPANWSDGGPDESLKFLRNPPDYASTPTYENLWPRREPVFPVKKPTTGDTFIVGEGYSDYCPVLWQNPLTKGNEKFVSVSYVRSLLVDVDGGKLLGSVSTLLQIHGSLGVQLPSGQWTAIRFLDKALKPLDTLLTGVEAYMLAILDGLQGVIDKIVAYIEGIQARIYQLQSLIEKIRSLLNALTLFDLPPLSGIVLVENGTDGIASALVTSGNKPPSDLATYGGGTVILFGGLPAVLLETITLLLGGGGDD